MNKRLHLPDDHESVAIGDMAHCADTDGRPLPGIAPVAIQQRAIRCPVDFWLGWQVSAHNHSTIATKEVWQLSVATQPWACWASYSNIGVPRLARMVRHTPLVPD